MYSAVAVMRHDRRPRIEGGGKGMEMHAAKALFAAEAESTGVVCSAKSCVICAYHRKKQQ
ncbi:hypothetical protein HYU17_04005 [Candidatus Woesearchaeota archaeon]|nr:hypothetical protein [Candidatus Woesearchaeota archaeon]